MRFANRFAPEHLSIPGGEAALRAQAFRAGSVFIGPWSAQSVGDYASGTNHVLPTGGGARSRGGLSTWDFVRCTSVQQLSHVGIAPAGAVVAALADAEGLVAHARAVEVRGGFGARCANEIGGQIAHHGDSESAATKSSAPQSVAHEVLRGTCDINDCARSSARHRVLAGAPSVRNLAPYAAPEEGRAGKLRLDFNENTVGCSPAVLRALRRITAEQLAIYPEYEESTRRLARHFGVRPAEMLLTNGVDDALRLLMETFVEPGNTVLIPEPTFSMYRFFSEVAGARVEAVRYDDADALSAGGDAARTEALAAHSVSGEPEQSHRHAARSRRARAHSGRRAAHAGAGGRSLFRVSRK